MPPSRSIRPVIDTLDIDPAARLSRVRAAMVPLLLDDLVLRHRAVLGWCQRSMTAGHGRGPVGLVQERDRMLKAGSPPFRIEDGHWIVVDHPRVRMPVSRLAALRGVDPAVAEHPVWHWVDGQWEAYWPDLHYRIAATRLRALVSRWMLIRMSERRVRPGRGSLLDATGGDGIMPAKWISLLRQHPAPFAVCGDMAVNYYAPPHYTDDLDIVVLIQDVTTWDAWFREHGWQRQGSLSIGGWTYSDGHDAIDVLVPGQDWVAPAIAAAAHNQHDGLPILPLEWLVWMKLSAGRANDQADLSRMLGRLTPDAFQRLIQTLSPWLSPEDREDLTSLYQLGRLELN